ncbi:MAG: DUF427 domain-containing protein [Gammaproteobacteria bacterium]|nr:DUF427 domain-containing protein [Gammaproteobacteria bacterium]MBU1444266.1 DUF427 domain-containing protein [Gammaproteobacteria bacterium]MBU2410226.1 DUF427 domain-containing protein [Gammaproteobacteria bacterium]
MSNDAERIARARAQWRYVGQERPPFAVEPRAGQESVWDYPRPPRIERDAREIVICLGVTEIARTRRALRVLETASPPTFYLPIDDIRSNVLESASGSSFCEWKGDARYLSVVVGRERLESAAWSYPDPLSGFEPLQDHVAFYPHRLDCRVDGERALPQPGRFYAGWITPELVGPFKGEPGSSGW